MFRGEDEHTIDDRGRVFLPTRYREGLGDRVLLVRGLDGQINLYTQSTWQAMAERVAQSNQPRSQIRNTSRLLFSASECEVDRQGRILIPSLLRRYADLGTDVIILGHDDHVELWSRERWQGICEGVVTQWRDNKDDIEKVAMLELTL